jgi:hypothetical protein
MLAAQDRSASDAMQRRVILMDYRREGIFASAIIVKNNFRSRNVGRITAREHFPCKNSRGVTLVLPVRAPASSFFS